ncbi:MAG: retropepsin-like aspartic protease [Cyanobacteria bacterium P01_H01_bin.15]
MMLNSLPKIPRHLSSWHRQRLNRKHIGQLVATFLLTLNFPTVAIAQSSLQGEAIVQELSQCLLATLTENPSADPEVLKAVSTQCFYQTLFLDRDGNIRSDIEDRLDAVVAITGKSLPSAVSAGQATVTLNRLPDTGLFSVPVKIRDRPLELLFDTGASDSILSATVAKSLELAGVAVPDEVFAYLVVGDRCEGMNASLFPLPPIAIDKAKVEQLNGLSVQTLFQSVPSIDGILGLNFLRQFDLFFDPALGQLQLRSPSTPRPDALPLTGRLGVMTIPVTINDEQTLTFLVDTGAELTVLSSAAANKISLPPSGYSAVQVMGLCGETTAKAIELESLAISSHRQTNLPAIILDSPVLTLLGIDGIVGQNYLNRYQQLWQFGPANALGYSETGGLVLSPLAQDNPYQP